MDSSNDIVIVGGGFAGTTAARALESRLSTPHRVVLVSEESYTTFNPMLAEVVGASVFPEHAVAPIRQMLGGGRDGMRFVMGRVVDADARTRTITAETLAGARRIAFSHLVLAFGTRAALDIVPGMAEHALPLKLVGDALHIRNRVLRCVARIELESDPAARRRLGRFVVIGGGFSGVEVAGALADFLRAALRYYPRVWANELSVVLLHDLPRLLPDLPAGLGNAAARSLAARGVEVRLGARAACIDGAGATLADGARIEAATVVCTIGTRPNPLAALLAERLGVATERGRIVTAPDLSAAGVPGVWAIGDCAVVRNHAGHPAAAPTAAPLAPPTAQFAVAEAQALARNLVAQLRGRPTRPFAYTARGMMATTGHLKGVALVGPLRLSGLSAWLLWRAVYLLRMPTLGRKLRIWVEWTWGMFFAADITHLRFTRTAELDPSSGATAPTHPVRP